MESGHVGVQSKHWNNKQIRLDQADYHYDTVNSCDCSSTLVAMVAGDRMPLSSARLLWRNIRRDDLRTDFVMLGEGVRQANRQECKGAEHGYQATSTRKRQSGATTS